jgi:hypothetical protein
MHRKACVWGIIKERPQDDYIKEGKNKISPRLFRGGVDIQMSSSRAGGIECKGGGGHLVNRRYT